MTMPIAFFRASAATGAMVFTLGGCSEAPDEIDYERYEVGSVVTLVSEPEPNGIFEFLTRLELAHDQLGFFVLDSYAKKVYRVDLDGAVQASMGGPGRGPGEFVFPGKIKSASDGVWVLDSGARATLFGLDGGILATLEFGQTPTTTVVPTTDGLILPATRPPDDHGAGPHFLHVNPDGRRTMATDAIDIPGGMAGGGYLDQVDWTATGVSDHEFVIVTNELDGWRITVDGEYQQLVEIRSLNIPAGIASFVQGIESPAPGMTLRAVSGTRVVDGRLWVVTAGLGPDLLGFSVPAEVGEPVALVYPGALAGRSVQDAIILSDRVVAITPTEILIANIEPLEADDVGGRPFPF